MKKLGFIGGGNMAEALARGLIAGRVFKPADLIVSDVDAKRRRRLARTLKLAVTPDNLEVLHQARAMLFAVKPQQMGEVLDQIAGSAVGTKGATGSALTNKLFISIAAGITLGRLVGALGPRARVIRVMPNAPAMVGCGMAAMVRSRAASRTDMAFALRVFRAVGDAVALDDEALLDAATALSGSGPAYVYLFVKALADAGASEGIAPELALRMALKTVEGAEYNMRVSGLKPEALIRIVASPGGTTEAALSRFAADGFSDMVAAAVHAAAQRSREIGRSY
jgi:pyrroline-5-carboxylate reductase